MAKIDSYYGGLFDGLGESERAFAQSLVECVLSFNVTMTHKTITSNFKSWSKCFESLVNSNPKLARHTLGLLGGYEGVFSGVALVAMPVNGDKKKNNAAQKAWVLYARKVVEYGLVPGKPLFNEWTSPLLRGDAEIDALRFFLETGALEHLRQYMDRTWRGEGVDYSGLASAFQSQSRECLDLLSDMAKAGLLSGSAPLLTPADFAPFAQHGSIRQLVSMGISWGVAHFAPFDTEGLDPVEGVLGAYAQRLRPSKRPEAQLGKIKTEIEALLALGAPLPGSGAYALIFWGSHQMDRLLAEPLAAFCMKLGVDANGDDKLAMAAGQALARDVILGNQPRRTLDRLISLGWSVSKKGQPLLAEALAYRRLDAKESEQVYDVAKSFGVEPKLFSKQGESPLHGVLRSRRPKLAKRMIMDGAPVDYVQPDGSCALHAICAQQSKASETLLDEFLANAEVKKLVNQRGTGGETPLHKAAYTISPAKIQALLRAGADPNAQDDLGDTPMRHLLKRWGRKAEAASDLCAQILRAAGADEGIVNKRGKTPLQAAIATAPTSTIVALARARPQDLLSMGKLAKQALRTLEKRRGVGMPTSEKIQLAHEMGGAVKVDRVEAKPKSGRRL